MAKRPEQPSEVFGLFIDDCKPVFKENLIAIYLFGSGARGDYRPGVSDINFLVILKQEGLKKLKEIVPLLRKWRKYAISTPLFLTDEFLKTSTDSYPLEFFGFKRYHVLVYGEDLLKDVVIKNADLRLQIEREIKGKLLHLRQNFLTSGLKPRIMKNVLVQTLPTFQILFEGILFLKGQEIPNQREGIFQAISEMFQLDNEVFQQLFKLRSGKWKPGTEMLTNLFEQYMNLIAKVGRAIE